MHDCMEVVYTMINGDLGHGIGGAIFDDCHHLSREFVKVEFEVLFS